MGKFVKTKELEAADTPLKISKVNVLAIENHVAASDIDVGLAAAATVSKAMKEKKISQLEALEFRKECATMLAVIVSKIQERSPLQFHFARKLQSLDPRVMVSKPESVVKMFQQVLKTLVEEKWKANQWADSELAQFRKLISEAKSITVRNLLHIVLPRKEWTNSSISFKRIKKIMSNCGQWWRCSWHCPMDRLQLREDFSVKKEVLNPNLEEMSLRAIRLIYSSLSTEIKWKERKEKKSFGGRTGISKEEEERTWKYCSKADWHSWQEAKEAEKQKNAIQMKALLMESNTSR